MSKRWYKLRIAVELVFSSGMMLAAFAWSSYVAYMDRGHPGVGGEYIFAGAAGYVAYKAINALFDILEEEIYASIERRRKKRSRNAS